MQLNYSPAKNEESRVELLIATVDNLTKTLEEQFTSQQRNLEASYQAICEQINSMRIKVECAIANSNESANMNTFRNLGISANKNGSNGMSREQILAMNACATPVKDTFVMQATPHNNDALTCLEHLQNSVKGKTGHREGVIAQNNTYNNQQSGMQAQSNFAPVKTSITTPVITPPVHISERKNYETVFSPVSHSSTSSLSVSHAKSHVSQVNEKNILYSRSARSLTESLADTSPLQLQVVNNTSLHNNDADNLMMMTMMMNGNSSLSQKNNNENDIYAHNNMNANNAKDLKSMTTMTTMMSKDGRGEANNLPTVERHEKDDNNISNNNRNRNNEESYLPNVQYYTTSATPIKTRMTAAFNAYQQMQNEGMNNMNNNTDASSVNENNELGLSSTWNDNFVANVMNDYNAYATTTTSSSLTSSSAAWRQNVLATFPSSEVQSNMHYFTGYGNNGGYNSNTNANVANAYDQTPHNVSKMISDYNGNSVKGNSVPLQLHHEESRNLAEIQSRTLGHSESTGLTDSSHTDVNTYHDVQLLDSVKSIGSQQIANNSISNTPLHTNIVPFSPEQRLSKQYFTNTVRAVYKKGRPHVVKISQASLCPSSNSTEAPNMLNGSNSNSSNGTSSYTTNSNSCNSKNKSDYHTDIVNHKNNNFDDNNSNDDNVENMNVKDDASIETIEVDNDYIDEFNDENLKKLGIDRTSSCKVLVEFKRERVYEYKSACFISPGSYVIVQADRGEDLGVVINTLCETRHELLEDEQVSNNPQQLHQQQQQCERESQTEKSLSSLNISVTPRSEATSPNKLGSSRYSNTNNSHNELAHSAILNSGSSLGDNGNVIVINTNINNHRSTVTEGVIEICLTGSTVPRSVGVDKGIILQLASKSDVEQLHGVQVELERRAVDVCSQRVLERALPMVIVDAEYQFDTKKIIFFYEAQQRMDFRELLRDLFKTFRARI